MKVKDIFAHDVHLLNCSCMAHAELAHTVVPVGDGRRNLKKNLSLCGFFLIRKWFPLSLFYASGVQCGAVVL
jgi:hypothetical protein